MSFRKTLVLTAVVLAVVGWAVCAQATIIYDAATDFSIVNGNPNGAWSYGGTNKTSRTPAGFMAFPRARDWTARGYADIDVWDAVDDDPALAYNTTSDPITIFGMATIAPHTLMVDSYPSYTGDNYRSYPSVVIRWTAPAPGGTIDWSANYTQLYFGADSGYSYAVWHNSTKLEGDTLVGGTRSTPIAASGNDLIVAAGDTMDFFTWGHTLTRLDVTIGFTPIPEPSTLALLATGLVGLLCYAWRKRK